MTKYWDIITQVARDRQVDVFGMLGPSRSRWYLYARVEAAERLFAIGYPPASIARFIHRDPSTIRFYLGLMKRRVSREMYGPPKPPRTTAKQKPPPRIIREKQQVLHREARKGRYLIPYAGAEVWRPRHGN